LHGGLATPLDNDRVPLGDDVFHLTLYWAGKSLEKWTINLFQVFYQACAGTGDWCVANHCAAEAFRKDIKKALRIA
jgi:hypothetical protein